jgi:hypothetical protein
MPRFLIHLPTTFDPTDTLMFDITPTGALLKLVPTEGEPAFLVHVTGQFAPTGYAAGLGYNTTDVRVANTNGNATITLARGMASVD